MGLSCEPGTDGKIAIDLVEILSLTLDGGFEPTGAGRCTSPYNLVLWSTATGILYRLRLPSGESSKSVLPDLAPVAVSCVDSQTVQVLDRNRRAIVNVHLDSLSHSLVISHELPGEPLAGYSDQEGWVVIGRGTRFALWRATGAGVRTIQELGRSDSHNAGYLLAQCAAGPLLLETMSPFGVLAFDLQSGRTVRVGLGTTLAKANVTNDPGLYRAASVVCHGNVVLATIADLASDERILLSVGLPTMTTRAHRFAMPFGFAWTSGDTVGAIRRTDQLEVVLYSARTHRP